MPTLKLEVATPSGLAIRTDAEWVQAPSVDGEFGVEPGHIPLLAVLKSGPLRYRAEGTNHLAVVGPGFVEAGPDKVLLLTEKFSTASNLEPSQIRTEVTEVDAKLRSYHGTTDSPEYTELRRQLDWAHARLDVVQERDKRS